MPFLVGLLSGILLTVLTVFLVDNVSVGNSPPPQTQKMVNWDVAAEKFRSSIASLQKEVREDVNQTTR